MSKVTKTWRQRSGTVLVADYRTYYSTNSTTEYRAWPGRSRSLRPGFRSYL